MLTLPISEIATLTTQIAAHGALRAAEIAGDEVFEVVVAVAVLLYETFPPQ